MNAPRPPNDINAAEEAAFRAAVEAGLESSDRGRLISYEKVRRWLLSWGSDKEELPPECG